MIRRRYRVKVEPLNGQMRAKASVVLQRYGNIESIAVGVVDLTADDAETKLAEMRARAKDLARQVKHLDGER
jgi:hypothetical protein